ncbi:MAG: hypothetical protein ABSE45_07330 [Candidatus Acidiferrales bacterium]|jgi:hypothetical protein
MRDKREPYDFSIGILRSFEVLEQDLPPLKRYTIVDSAGVGKARSNFTSIITVGLGESLPLFVLRVVKERFEDGDLLAHAIAEAISVSEWSYLEDAAGLRLIEPQIVRALGDLGAPSQIQKRSFFSVGNRKDAKRQRILDAQEAAEKLGIIRFVIGECEALLEEALSIDGPGATDDAWDSLGQALIQLDVARLHRAAQQGRD